jgi:inosine/xanthosine triphosphatase
LKDETLLVAVGSTNPAKIRAVEEVLSKAVEERLLPGVAHYMVRSLEVESGVSAQPVGDEETMLGAMTRAAAVLEKWPEAQLGVGIEGGIVYHTILGQTTLLTTAWCAIRSQKGAVSYGGGLLLPLPPAIIQDLEKGFELGEANDRLFKVKDSKRAGGVIGYLSKGLETRQEAYESIFTYALVKFLNPELYGLENWI